MLKDITNTVGVDPQSLQEHLRNNSSLQRQINFHLNHVRAANLQNSTETSTRDRTPRLNQPAREEETTNRMRT
jgi:hypothetical protein